MTKKGCCCVEGVTGPYDDCCAPIGQHCVGKTIEFQFEIISRYFCREWGSGTSNTTSAKYWCETSNKSFPIVNNPEKFIITLTHTINNPAKVPGGTPYIDGYETNYWTEESAIKQRSWANWSCCNVDPRTDYRNINDPSTLYTAQKYIENWGYGLGDNRLPCYWKFDQYAPGTPPYGFGCDCLTNSDLATCNFSLSEGVTCGVDDGARSWGVGCPAYTGPFGTGWVLLWNCNPPTNPSYSRFIFGEGNPFPPKMDCFSCARSFNPETGGPCGQGFGLPCTTVTTSAIITQQGSLMTFPWNGCFGGYYLGDSYLPKVEEKLWPWSQDPYSPERQKYCIPIQSRIPNTEFALSNGFLRKDTMTYDPYDNGILQYILETMSGLPIYDYQGGKNNLQNLNLGQNYSVQFVPNPAYPEQMEEDYVPKLSPILLDFRYRCGREIERDSLDWPVKYGNSLNKNMIEVKLAFSYYNEFNCGTEEQPSIEILDIPFKAIELDDNIPISDFNTQVIGCEQTAEGCPPTKRYVFSSPIWLGKFGRRTLRNESKHICVPPSRQTVPFDTCSPGLSKNNLNLYHQDDYTTCFTLGWRILPQDLYNVEQYNDQLVAKGYKYSSLIVTDSNGSSTINFGYCDIKHTGFPKTRQNRAINGWFFNNNFFRYWSNFSDRVDVITD